MLLVLPIGQHRLSGTLLGPSLHSALPKLVPNNRTHHNTIEYSSQLSLAVDRYRNTRHNHHNLPVL
jgi:hypothetical protein